MIYFGSISFASSNGLNNSRAAFLNSFLKLDSANKNDLLFSQGKALAIETPDLKIIQDNSLGGVSTVQVLTPRVLGDILGTSDQDRKDVIEYNVQPGDTLQSIAQNYGISVNTLLWANSLTSSSTIKVGQTLIILPVNGIIYVIKSGDTISELGKKYKSKIADIVAFIRQDKDAFYKLAIGTDSHGQDPANVSRSKTIEFVTAVVIHRKGYGGRYFWQKKTVDKIGRKGILRRLKHAAHSRRSDRQPSRMRRE